MASLPLPPGSTIGVIGGGQLGRMLALAAARLGLDTVILEPEPDCPAGRVAARTIVAPYDDPVGLKALAAAARVVTYEFENVPASAVQQLVALGVDVAPGGQALAVAQDRQFEKTFLNAHGAPTVAFASAATADEARQAAAQIGVPALMKTRREGYDGKGQRWVEHIADAEAAFAELGEVPVILEAACDFVRELSVIAARGRDGATAVYPLAENHHEGGILRRSIAPARVTPAIADQAERIAARVLAGLDGCEVDQFEQHIRALAGWPLGPTRAIAGVEMLNLLGDEADGWARFAAEPESRIHLYGKREAKPGRKMGHVNRVRAL